MKTIGLTFLRLFLTATFLVAGALKVQAPDRFLLDVEGFGLLPGWLAYATALVLPWVEILAALGLWWKRLARGAALLLTLSALSFIGVLVVAEVKGLDLNCGCFGDWLIFPSLWSHLLFNAGLVVASVVLLRPARAQSF